MFNSLLTRELKIFGLTLSWNGDDFIYVVSSDRIIEQYSIKGLGARSACEGMRILEDRMNNDCVALT